MRVKLSQKALAVCKANYQSNCHNCPLRQPCVHSPIPRTIEDLSRNNVQINAAAEEIQL